MTEKHPNLAAALAAFQAELPRIGKENTATVPTKTGGQYTYKYADLSDVSAAVLPVLAKHGLSFSSKPTLTDDGRFVLAYVLRHEVDGEDAGSYPLPHDGTPQSIGSAISYARRYVLSAITGVAPDQDDDGAAATAQHDYTGHRRQPAQRASQPAPEPAQDQPPAQSPADRERNALVATAKEKGWDLGVIAAEYSSRYDGEDIRAAESAPRLKAFGKLLPDLMPTAATNGAAT